jgi:Na+/H+ antiporter NhaD/arsenite permease-like protein
MTAIMIITFAAGYTAIALEHKIRLNKAAAALITGVLCWVIYVLFNPHPETTAEQLSSHLGELSGILFFIMSAMTIVELIDSHDSFSIITDKITQTNKKKLIWIIGIITFFMSAVLDNLTTTIVIVTLLRKLIRDNHDRLYFAGTVIIAANAGGAWSPIGDVTTTMLWIGGHITAFNIIVKLILPSLVCLVVPLTIVSLMIKGNAERSEMQVNKPESVTGRHQKIILFSGITALISVPVFKTLTGLPPYMGILLALGIIWIINEILHGSIDEADRHKLSVVHALRKIDTSTILFFLGILLAISALQTSGILEKFSGALMSFAGNESVIAILIGLLSSIVDNVPLVAATQGMFDLTQYPTDHYFWEFLAYTTGTGGSALIIGSAAGVAAMGIEKIDFVWYLKKISWLALAGFFSGAGIYILQDIIAG